MSHENTITLWDEQLTNLNKEIDEQASALMDLKNFTDQDAIEAKLALLQFQSYLDRCSERLSAMNERKSQLPTRERTMLHWGQIYCSKVREYYDLQVRTWIKLVWLRLIESRLTSDPKPTISMLSDDQLLNLATRQQHMAQAEDHLTAAMLKLSQRKQQMRRRYDELMTITANRTAAAAMQSRLGQGPQDATKHPALINTGHLLRRFAHRILAPREELSALYRYEKQIEEQSQAVVAKCRSLALEVLKPQSRPQKQTNDRAFQQALADIDSLSKKIDDLTASTGFDRPPLRPKMMKNIANQATTCAE